MSWIWNIGIESYVFNIQIRAVQDAISMRDVRMRYEEWYVGNEDVICRMFNVVCMI